MPDFWDKVEDADVLTIDSEDLWDLVSITDNGSAYVMTVEALPI